MDAPFPDVDPAEAMLARLAGLDLSLAQHVHACALSTEDPTEVANLARAYQRVSRSMRQSLALHARLKRERLRDARENPPPPPRKPARDERRIAERQEALRAPVQRVVWAEYEHAEHEDEAGYYFDLLEERLAHGAGDDAFGLVLQDNAWAVEPLDEHIVSLCRSLGLPEIAARAWRELPDPPPEVLLPPDDDADEDDPPDESSA
jgi:hypothetical protein